MRCLQVLGLTAGSPKKERGEAVSSSGSISLFYQSVKKSHLYLSITIAYPPPPPPLFPHLLGRSSRWGHACGRRPSPRHHGRTSTRLRKADGTVDRETWWGKPRAVSQNLMSLLLLFLSFCVCLPVVTFFFGPCTVAGVRPKPVSHSNRRGKWAPPLQPHVVVSHYRSITGSRLPCLQLAMESADLSFHLLARRGSGGGGWGA